MAASSDVFFGAKAVTPVFDRRGRRKIFPHLILPKAVQPGVLHVRLLVSAQRVRHELAPLRLSGHEFEIGPRPVHFARQPRQVRRRAARMGLPRP